MPPGAEGAVAPSLAWKVCAVLPLVLLVVLMGVKVAGNFGEDDSKETSQAQEPEVIPTTPSTPTPSESPRTAADKDAEIKGGAPKPSELPEGQIATTAPSIPDAGGFTLPPGPADLTATPGPSKNPTKKPSPSSSPSPTPTPSEARQQCIDKGVNALNIAALAACIADLMDPSS